MYQTMKWLKMAIETTGTFIAWLLLVIVALVIAGVGVIVIYALVKAIVDAVKGKKNE